MSYKKFAVNNYVVYRIKDEWQECRVKEILPGDGKDNKNLILHVIKNNNIHHEPVSDMLVYNSSLENQKKFRYTHRFDEFQFPMFLVHFLTEDKLKVRNNLTVFVPSKYPLKKILHDFGKFLLINKASVMEDELDEVVKGFCHAFDKALHKYLIYDRELEHVERAIAANKKHRLCEIYGIEHLVRLMHFMCCKTKNEDEIIIEYVYYLCDFLDLNYKKYFVDRKYEEIK
ncbi:hypothetical protein COBT_002198 [Conglomerata obtusa]